MRMLLVVLATVFVAAACGGSDEQQDGRALKFVNNVRANNMAEMYSDKQLAIMLDQMCKVTDAGSDPEQILDNYSQLSVKEQRELADMSATAC